MLLLDVGGRIVGKVVTAALELVSRGEFGLLVPIRVESLEGRLVCSAFRLREGTRSVGEPDTGLGRWLRR